MLIFSLFISIFINQALCSHGDKDQHFILCANSCENFCSRMKPKKFIQISDKLTNYKEIQASKPLILFRWTCISDCKYQCIQLNYKERKMNNSRVVKYYGRWPLKRIYGIEEFFSVILCFIELLVIFNNLRYYSSMYKLNETKNYCLKYIIKMFKIHIIQCISSIIFHTRNNKYTERLDYYSVIVSLLYTLYFSFILLIKSKFTMNIIKLIIISISFLHISYLQFYKFDYGLNNNLVGIYVIILLLLTLTFSYLNKIGMYELFIFLICVVFASLVLKWDFPAYYDLIDAHSIWHLHLIFIRYSFYRYLENVNLFENKKIKLDDK